MTPNKNSTVKECVLWWWCSEKKKRTSRRILDIDTKAFLKINSSPLRIVCIHHCYCAHFLYRIHQHCCRVHHCYHADAVRSWQKSSTLIASSIHARPDLFAHTLLSPFFFHHLPTHHCTVALQFFNKIRVGCLLPGSPGSGVLPNVSFASQLLAHMLRLLQAAKPQPPDGWPPTSQGSHVALGRQALLASAHHPRLSHVTGSHIHSFI